MKTLFLVLCLLALKTLAQVCSNDVQAAIMDLKGPTQVQGENLNTLSCNAQTRIDFIFDQAAADDLKVTLDSGNQYLFEDSKQTYLQFLNRDGKDLKYKLTGISMNPYSNGNAKVVLNNIKTTPDYQLSLTYSDPKNNEDTIISIYILKYNSPITPGDGNIIVEGEKSFSQINGLYGLIKSFSNVSSSNQIRNVAGGLSYLQNPDLSQFYTVQIEPLTCGKKVNFLLSGFTIKLTENIDLSSISATTTYIYSQNQQKTGNKLCYGSQNNDGVFQSHLRESYPLWAAWFSVIFFWISVLFGESNTMYVYDKKFQNNKWTSWELYSLWYLAHEQFFSRIMRSTAYLASFGIICLVTACLYGVLDISDKFSLTILFFGIAGAFGAFIFSFVTGFFMNGVNKWTSIKFNIKSKIKQISYDKDSLKNVQHQLQMDECQDKIYFYYYWFYLVTVCVIVSYWALSIHFMQMPPRQDYYLMYYWVASVGVGIGLFSLVLTPLWSLLAGNYAIAQLRGFWYDYRLGQNFRESQN